MLNYLWLPWCFVASCTVRYTDGAIHALLYCTQQQHLVAVVAAIDQGGTEHCIEETQTSNPFDMKCA